MERILLTQLNKQVFYHLLEFPLYVLKDFFTYKPWRISRVR